MFLKIFLFEINYRLRRPATYAYFGILFLFAIITGIYGNGPASEKAFVNASYTIGQLLIIISIFSMLIASAVMGVPVYRDIEYGTKDYFFAYPIREKSYLLGRYLGSFTILILISFGLPIGYLIGLPIGVGIGEIEPERLGPFVLSHYLYPIGIFTLPNLFFTGTLFFSLVALTKNVRITYVGSVLLFVGYLLANVFTQDLDNKDLVDILDPFALTTYINATKYWTPVEQNLQMPPLEGNLLFNRLLWVGISLAIFIYTYSRFSFQRMLQVASGKKKTEEEKSKHADLHSLPIVSKLFSTRSYFTQMLRQASLEFGNIIKDVYFIAILLAGVLFLFLDGWFGDPTYGTPSLPLTYLMLEVKDFNYGLFVFIIIIFYTGEVVHRDRSVNYSNIADALPVPNWVTYGSKFLSLVMICFILVNAIMLCGVLNQTLKGYFNYEFNLYFTDLYLIEFPDYLELTMLAFIVHILVNNKFLGHVVSIGIWILLFSLRNFAELNYNLFFYSYIPNYTISDMNGFGHYLVSSGWFNLYWLSLGVIFLLIGNLFWNRGSETAARIRIRIARTRLNKNITLALILFIAIFISSGSYIYYNVSKLNKYETRKEGLKKGADFERKYSKYELTAQPKIFDAKIFLDLFPRQRSVDAKGEFKMMNKSDQPLDSLHFFVNSQVRNTKIIELRINDQVIHSVIKDTIHNYYCYLLPSILNPGDSVSMTIKMHGEYRGFDNGGTAGSILYNGSFINLGIFPTFGYPGDMINSDKERKKHNLPEKKYTLPPQNDKHGLSNFLFTDDADWVTYEAIVSTEEDQIAISPGYLQKEWTENGRHFYHYKMNNKMDLFANFSSARYAIHRDHWVNDKGEKVNIEIYYHPTHSYNLDRFTKSVKASFDYYSKNFSPYQYTQMRILEFPRYQRFAQSFPNTVPYSESFGWTADFSDPEDTDYAFYVTAHEVAHQWWGHQVMPSATRGANQISESMAEYSALMVLKHEYGDECMQRFLKYSLDRYLRGRAGESKFEATLLDNDSRAYVWYQKGSLVLYALQDLIGENNLNNAFRNFVDSTAFREKAPFATSNEWYSYIEAATPDSLKYFIEDSFDKITLYENRILSNTYEKTSDNKYKVTLEVQSRKVYYDEKGNEIGDGTTPNYIDIGIFDEDGKNERGMTKKVPLYLKKHLINPGISKFEIIVDKLPVKAGVDPYNKLIDRIPDDNVKSVESK